MTVDENDLRSLIAEERVANVLLLGQQMQLDLTKPLEVQKVLRHLTLIEQAVRDDLND